MQNKSYVVTLPIAGYITCEVQAENEEDAIQTALEKDWLKKIVLEDDFECQDINTYDKIIEGNICHIEVCEAEAEEIED